MSARPDRAPRAQALYHALALFVAHNFEHMHLEESVILPEAEAVLTEDDWAEMDAQFEKNADPLTGNYPPPAEYEQLFSLIVQRAPAPIGLG